MDKSELLQLQTNANPLDNSTYFNEDRTVRLELEKTPYYIVGSKEEGYCVTFGKYKISEQFATGEYVQQALKEAYKYLEEHKYNILFHTMCAIQNVHTELTKDTIKTN